MQNWEELIFSDLPFKEKAQRVFEHQYAHNPVYRRFCDALNDKPGPENPNGDDFEELLDQSFHDAQLKFPLLPVRAFKDVDVFTREEENSELKTQNSQLIFKSSGTSTMERSTHHVPDEELYRRSIFEGFKTFYDLNNAVILGYMPGYSENSQSSLIWMINELITHDEIKKSRFLPLGKPLNQAEIDDIAAAGKQIIIFGAAFGLVDLVEISSVDLPSNSIIIETGGMKTHRRETGRITMHRRLAEGFSIDISRIHSEYGMCELLSQAYTTGGKWFRSVPWMQVSVRNPENPQQTLPPHKEGLIGIIDLANVHSCSFLLTGDRGMMDEQGRFQVLGRWQPNDLRGCNFLINED